jgi:hypothetical protein
MESNNPTESSSFFARVGMAFRLLLNSEYAEQVRAGLKALQASTPKPAAGKALAASPERLHASGLMLLAALQREGRLIDFVQQDVAGFSDEDVGAAARIVHDGCRKALQQYFSFQPAIPESEGSTLTVPPGFDAHRIRLSGNVAGQAPFKGTVKHHGWVAKEIRMPAVPDSLDMRVVAPAEVELP